MFFFTFIVLLHGRYKYEQIQMQLELFFPTKWKIEIKACKFRCNVFFTFSVFLHGMCIHVYYGRVPTAFKARKETSPLPWRRMSTLLLSRNPYGNQGKYLACQIATSDFWIVFLICLFSYESTMTIV